MAKPRNPRRATAESGGAAAAAAPAKITPDAQAVPNTSVTENAASTPSPVRQAAPAKPTLVRSEARGTIVPINLEDEVRRLAYLLAERRGFEPGHDTEDWLAAEREVMQRYHQQRA